MVHLALTLLIKELNIIKIIAGINNQKDQLFKRGKVISGLLDINGINQFLNLLIK